jgi:predicted amidophosphoribosyltransferase
MGTIARRLYYRIKYGTAINNPKVMAVNPQRLIGNWSDGYALDFHTLSSELIGFDKNDFQKWNTKRPPIAEALYRFKYKHELRHLPSIAKTACDFIDRMDQRWNIDHIIPVPPSQRRFGFRPTFELAKLIGFFLDIDVLQRTLQKTRRTPAIKEIEDFQTRKELLRNAYRIYAERIADKNILLVDDLYRSGATLSSISTVLENAKVKNIYVLTITKTRSNR